MQHGPRYTDPALQRWHAAARGAEKAAAEALAKARYELEQAETACSELAKLTGDDDWAEAAADYRAAYQQVAGLAIRRGKVL